MEPETRGDPMSPLRWTSKSTRTLPGAGRAGTSGVGPTVATLLIGGGVQPAGQRQDDRGQQHPDRDAQFRYLNEQAEEHLAAGGPVIRVDTKKKELVGGTRTPAGSGGPGQPEQVNVHDFPDQQLGKAIPYGVYDVAANTGWVNVGTDHDTRSSPSAIRRWWDGSAGRLPRRRPTADHRGRRRLQRLPDPIVEGRAGRARRRERAGDHRVPPPARHLEVEQDRAPAVLPHLHELAGRPLTSHEVIVNTIAATTTRTGLKVHAELDTASYPTGIKIPDREMKALDSRDLARHAFHGDWNYTLRAKPGDTPETDPN